MFGVSVPCQPATPVANVKGMNAVKMSRICIKSDRWRVVGVFGQTTEYHLAFVREELCIV